MFLIIPTIFFNNIFSSFLAAFLYSKKGAKIEKRTHRSSIPCKNVKIMKKCSKNSVFFTIRISEFGASIFGRSNGPNISGFRIIRISGVQHWCNGLSAEVRRLTANFHLLPTTTSSFKSYKLRGETLPWLDVWGVAPRSPLRSQKRLALENFALGRMGAVFSWPGSRQNHSTILPLV